MHGNKNGLNNKQYENIDKSLGFASDCGHIKRIIGRDYSELKKKQSLNWMKNSIERI